MAVAVSVDPIALAQDLIRCPSITPVDAGALDTLEGALRTLGFVIRRHPFGDVDNLYARLGTRGPNFCFAGHTDVVPPGPESAWSSPPFAATVRDGELVGRGAVDMKGAIAAFVAAVSVYLEAQPSPPGSISLRITGDEEGPAVNGTRKVLEALAAQGERIDHCLLGEPTGAAGVGDTIKVGRRGSLNGLARATGWQGHVAYPERAENPIPALLELLGRLMARRLDDGDAHFQPSNLEITSIDVGNTATNVIPAEATARFNIRFNALHTGEQLARWIEAERAAAALTFPGELAVETTVSGEAFLTDPGPFVDLLAEAAASEIGRPPALSTSGGTSDARFIKDHAPVAEMGLCGASMHRTDEHVATADVLALTRIYARVLTLYFLRLAG